MTRLKQKYPSPRLKPFPKRYLPVAERVLSPNQQAQPKKSTSDVEVEDKEDDTETSSNLSPPATGKKPILAPGPKKLPAGKAKLAVIPKKAIAIGAGPKKGGFKGLQPKAPTAEPEKKVGRMKKVAAKVSEKKKVNIVVKAEDEDEGEEQDGSEQDEDVAAGSDKE